MGKPISISEYARRHGVTAAAIFKAIKAKKIVNGIVVVDGKNQIDPEIADKEWGQNHNPAYNRTTKAGGKLFQNSSSQPDEELSFNDAKKKKAQYDAHLAELEYQEKKRVLVNRQDVYIELYNFAKILRNNMQAIPNRVVDLIRNAPDRQEAYNILAAEIDRQLGELAKMDTLPAISETQPEQ